MWVVRSRPCGLGVAWSYVPSPGTAFPPLGVPVPLESAHRFLSLDQADRVAERVATAIVGPLDWETEILSFEDAANDDG